MSHPGIDLIRQLLGDRAESSPSVEQRRADLEALTAASPVPEGVTVSAAPVGGRPAERIVPDTVSGPGTLLYLHGGAYLSGSLNTHRAFGANLALAAERVVVTLDYRLAPEDPFPAAVDDALAAFDQLAAEGPVAVGGDSAGGGLTLAVLLALRERGGTQPVAGLCFSPWADLTQSGTTYATRDAADPMLSKAILDEAAGLYLDGHDATDPLASPLLADDLAGLPPLRIDVGDAEVLLADAEVFAAKVEAAGGEVDLTVWPEVIHVFSAFPPDLIPEAAESVAASGAFLAKHLT